MPITYEIDRARGLLRTRCVGATSLDEVLEHFKELRADPDVPARAHILLDMTAQVSAPERDQLRAVVAEMKSLGTDLRWGALAIVAKTDLLFGMSRILGVFVEDSFSHVGVFRQTAEAERWLEAHLSASR
jgi:hypothetical protein